MCEGILRLFLIFPLPQVKLICGGIYRLYLPCVHMHTYASRYACERGPNFCGVLFLGSGAGCDMQSWPVQGTARHVHRMHAAYEISTSAHESLSATLSDSLHICMPASGTSDGAATCMPLASSAVLQHQHRSMIMCTHLTHPLRILHMIPHTVQRSLPLQETESGLGGESTLHPPSAVGDTQHVGAPY